MERCREVKLHLSLKKLQFMVSEEQFHGPEKFGAIITMPNPTDAKGVQHLIGFANKISQVHATSVSCLRASATLAGQGHRLALAAQA